MIISQVRYRIATSRLLCPQCDEFFKELSVQDVGKGAESGLRLALPSEWRFPFLEVHVSFDIRCPCYKPCLDLVHIEVTVGGYIQSQFRSLQMRCPLTRKCPQVAALSHHDLQRECVLPTDYSIHQTKVRPQTSNMFES